MSDRDLLTLDQAAEMLTISTKTLRAHVKAGDIAYIPIGRGQTRVRMSFDRKDILDFIDRRRKRQCPSTNTPKVRTINTISSSTVIAFTDLPKPQTRKKH